MDLQVPSLFLTPKLKASSPIAETWEAVKNSAVAAVASVVEKRIFDRFSFWLVVYLNKLILKKTRRSPNCE